MALSCSSPLPSSSSGSCSTSGLSNAFPVGEIGKRARLLIVRLVVRVDHRELGSHMSNADQLKYMRMQETLDKKPTPIRRKSPKPIEFPKPKQPVTQEVTQDIPKPEPDTQRLIPFPRPPISVELRNFIAHCISRTLYKVADYPIASIQLMSETEFEVLCRSILEDEA